MSRPRQKEYYEALPHSLGLSLSMVAANTFQMLDSTLLNCREGDMVMISLPLPVQKVMKDAGSFYHPLCNLGRHPQNSVAGTPLSRMNAKFTVHNSPALEELVVEFVLFCSGEGLISSLRKGNTSSATNTCRQTDAADGHTVQLLHAWCSNMFFAHLQQIKFPSK